MNQIPNWVIDMVIAVDEYEDRHAHVKEGGHCMERVLDAVPPNVLGAVRMVAEYRSTANEEDADPTLQRLREMHTPYDTTDGDTVRQRCKHCIGAYDMKTGRLLNTAWPCPTSEVLSGGERP